MSQGNLRDLGGLPAAGGLRVRAGVVYRSAAPCGLAREAVPALRGLGLRCVVDLRTSGERLTDDRPWLDDGGSAELVTLPSADRFAASAAVTLAGELVAAGAAAVEALMVDAYRRFPEILAPAVGEVGRRIVAGKAPLLVHCRAGKDRTGFLCAALLHLLGVERTVIEDEYLRSNVSVTAAWLAESLGSEAGRPVPPRVVEPLLCHPDYLAASFDAMRAEAGSVDAYLAEHAGITGELRQELRAALLAPDTKEAANVAAS